MRASPDAAALASMRNLAVDLGPRFGIGANVTVCPETVPVVSPVALRGTISLGKLAVTTTFESDSEP